MVDHILQVTVRRDDTNHFYIDMEVDAVTYAVLGPYDTRPSDTEAEAIAMSCVRMDGYSVNSPLIWNRQT